MSRDADSLQAGMEKMLEAVTQTNAELAAGASKFFAALFKQDREAAQRFDALKADIARGSRTSPKHRRRPL